MRRVRNRSWHVRFARAFHHSLVFTLSLASPHLGIFGSGASESTERGEGTDQIIQVKGTLREQKRTQANETQ